MENTPERVSALERLGPITDSQPLPAQTETSEPSSRRRLVRPPGRRVTAYYLSVQGAGVRKRRTTKATPSPCKRSTRTIPRNEENHMCKKVGEDRIDAAPYSLKPYIQRREREHNENS
ncbi:hypothetical protein DY000_02008655 [Brassica cretica]|uniref:Uncharacterized protein n=1 Tax=Brassica cretica TaxID=69181 RepID=A0ABQ7CLX6_BRACR|nr:hypothetical protein DY000_02008655 [Brassica cretica]